MMRKNNNRNNNMKHRGGNNGGGQRRYQSNGGGGGNRGQNDGQNLTRQKHHATQQLGKYGDMARNAQINGDRVDVEYYLQHVDHYTRVLADIAVIEAERYAHQRESQIIPGGPNDPAYQQQQQSENTDAGAHSSAPEASPVADGSAAIPAAAEVSPAEPRAPRAPRQPRRASYQPPQASDNGAAEANSNTTEIPLPGGILPPI